MSSSFRLPFRRYVVNTYPLVGKIIENIDQLFGLSNRSYISTKEMTNFAVI